MIIKKDIQFLKNEISEIRKEIHKNPEVGFKEYKTSEFVKKKLKAYGIEEIHEIAKTGVVGFLRGCTGEKTTAFRSDMDGLPLREENCVPYKSVKEGFMHACGHDGHVAALLGFAKYAVDHRNEIRDNLVFIFQPAEEGPGGAEVMINEGIIEKFKIDRIIGMHIFPEYPQGKIASRSGALMARNGEVSLKVKGLKAHGAMPEKGIDAIVAASSLIMDLQTIISRSINPMESAVLTFGKIKGGEAVNVTADEVTIGGTLRAFNDDIYDKIVERIYKVAEGTETIYGCSIEVDFNHMYQIVNNDVFLEKSLKRAVGKEDYILSDRFMISEDFSFFQKKVPGLFFFLGCYNQEQGYTHPLHSNKFNFDEKILLSAVQTYVNLLNEI